MTISVQSGDSGWSEYVLGVDELRKLAKLIEGDIKLGDAICNSTDYKSGQYFRIVVSFSPEENISPELGREITKEAIELLMHGYREDEYHKDIVEHGDTDNLHYHVRIPKLNLFTQTQLHYHYKSDIKRKDAIHAFLEAKHNLINPFEKRKLRPDSNKRVEQINKWRADHEQKPFDLSKKKGRGEAEERISDYIEEAVRNGLIDNLEEVQAELVAMGFRIAKVGHDIGKDFDYVTIENESGKLRLQGDIYGKRFYEHDRENRAKAIESGRSLDSRDGSDRPSLAEAKRVLDKANKQRNEFIESRFKAARGRALSNAPTPPPSDRGRVRDRGKSNKGQRGKIEKKSVGSERESSRTDRREIKNLGEVNDRDREEAISRIRAIRERARARAKASRREFEEAHGRVAEQTDRVVRQFEVKLSGSLDESNIGRRERKERINRITEQYGNRSEEDYRAIEQAVRHRQYSQATTATLYRVLEWLNDRKSKITNSLNRGKRTANQLNKWVRAVVGKGEQMQELDRFKQEINLAEYAQTFGYTIDKKKSTKISPVLKKDGDTLVIGQSRSDSHYIYFNTNSDSDKGSVIDFVKNRTNESLGNIRKRLRNWLGMEHPPVEKVEVKVATLDEIGLQLSKDKALTFWNNIEEQLLFRGELRSIPNKYLFNSKASKDVKYDGNQWYFSLRDSQDEICGVEIRNKEGQNARVGAGHKKGIFAVGGQDAEICNKIIITESTIDAKSAEVMAGGATYWSHTFVSIGGNAGIIAEAALKELCERLPNAEIIIATDNDTAGDKHTQKIKEIIGHDRKYTRLRPQGKDLNDDLPSFRESKEKKQQKTNTQRLKR